MSKIGAINKESIKKFIKGKWAIAAAGIAGLVFGYGVNEFVDKSKDVKPIIITGDSQLDETLRALHSLGVKIDTSAKLGTIDRENGCGSFSLANCYNSSIGLNDNAIKLLEDKAVPTGIIIEPTSTTISCAYLNIDYVKNIVEKYEVGYPICINIDTICDILDKSQAEIDVVIGTYAEKLSANGCVVIIVGSEENISRIKDSEHYTKGLIISADTKEINGTYDFILSEFGVYSVKDYYELIKTGNYQTASSFVSDLVHTVSEGETLTGISDIYGISIRTLQNYNKLYGSYGTYSDILYVGQELVIPNVYDDLPSKLPENDVNPLPTISTNDVVVENEVDVNKYYKGIDVSEYQGEIDWEVAREKIDFAILRVADAANRDANGNITLDRKFIYNVTECNRLGIPVGVYIYTRADNVDELNEEIRFVLEVIKPYNITLPIYRDLEGSRAEALVSSESERKNQVSLTDKFCSTMEAAGYPSGVYLHKKYLSYISELGSKYSIWAQGGYYYATDCDFDDMIYAMESPDRQFELTYTVNIFQSTQNGLARELGISSDYVDFNYVDREFVDSLIKIFDKQGNVYVESI